MPPKRKAALENILTSLHMYIVKSIESNQFNLVLVATALTKYIIFYQNDSIWHYIVKLTLYSQI